MEQHSIKSELPFSRFFQWFSSPTVTRLGGLSVFLIACLTFLLPAARNANPGAPPEAGDGPDYDNLAVELSKGNGFSFNWDDPEFRSPYEAHINDGRYDYLLDRQGAWTTALKPPLFPFLMALDYKIFGRHFGVIRVMNSIFMALSVAMAFMIIARSFGVGPGILCTALLLLDYRFPPYATLVLTEAVTCLLVMAMLWCLLRTVETRSRRWACILGVVTAVAFLARNPLVLWVPVLAIPVLAFSVPEGERVGFRALGLPSLFIAMFLLVAAPWMIRNCVLLGGFEPLGTMSVDLPAGFSDKAVGQNGVWFNMYETRGTKAKPGETRYYDRVPTEGSSLVEQELIRSRRGKAEAVEWALQNPAKVVLLAWLKIRSEWRPIGLRQTLLLVFAALGLVFLLRRARREAAVFFCILAACTLSIAITWSVGGRFIVPVLPVVIGLSSVGMWSFVTLATEFTARHKRRSA